VLESYCKTENERIASVKNYGLQMDLHTTASV